MLLFTIDLSILCLCFCARIEYEKRGRRYARSTLPPSSCLNPRLLMDDLIRVVGFLGILRLVFLKVVKINETPVNSQER